MFSYYSFYFFIFLFLLSFISLTIHLFFLLLLLSTFFSFNCLINFHSFYFSYILLHSLAFFFLFHNRKRTSRSFPLSYILLHSSLLLGSHDLSFIISLTFSYCFNFSFFYIIRTSRPLNKRRTTSIEFVILWLSKVLRILTLGAYLLDPFFLCIPRRWQ